jgi:hypothetical protein
VLQLHCRTSAAETAGRAASTTSLCRGSALSSSVRDWRHGEGSENPAEIAKYRALEPNGLYYCHYTSDAPPEPLAPFAALKTPVWNVDVYHDAALSWAIRAGMEDHPLSPRPVRRAWSISMVRRIVSRSWWQYGAASSAAGAVQQAAGRIPGRSDESASCIARRAPAILREWLDAQFDVDAHMAAMQMHFFGFSQLDAGMAAFLQALEQPLSYRLQLDCVGNFYRAQKRR